MVEEITDYQPLTAVNKIVDVELPITLTLGGQVTEIPKPLLEKQVSYRLLAQLGLTRTAWIHKGLAHILNSKRQGNADIAEIEVKRAIIEIDKEINRVVKDGVLRDRQGPGCMSFAQAHESVPPDSVVISRRSYDALCQTNSRWKNTKTVLTVRFPNLGPNTTQLLKLVVGKAGEEKPFSEDSLYYRLPELNELKAIYDELTEGAEDHIGTIDPFYFNQSTLKDGFEGDADGDLVFIVADGRGTPEFRHIDFEREPGPISQDAIETMLKKANRVERVGVADWLHTYMDANLIGRATYIIRREVYNLLPKYKDTDHPMYYAWNEIAPMAIELIEFVMDIKKGEFTPAQIAKKMQYIESKHREISNAKKAGDWFANTVTASHIENVGEFVKRFPTLQEFIDYVTMAPTKKTLADLLEGPQ